MNRAKSSSTKTVGQSQGVVREDAGEEHVQLSHRADVKAAKDSLFAKHDEGGAETPEAAHNVEAENGAKEIGRLALGRT